MTHCWFNPEVQHHLRPRYAYQNRNGWRGGEECAGGGHLTGKVRTTIVVEASGELTKTLRTLARVVS